MHADLPSFRISSPWPRPVEVSLVEVRFVDLTIRRNLLGMRQEGKGGEGADEIINFVSISTVSFKIHC